MKRVSPIHRWGAALALALPLISSRAHGEERSMGEWKGIVPGTSSREDVRRILGEPARSGRGRFLRFEDSAYEVYLDGEGDPRVTVHYGPGGEIARHLQVRNSPEDAESGATRLSKIVEDLGEAPSVLASPFQPGLSLHVYPERGQWFEADATSVTGRGYFPPMSADEFERAIYAPPGPAIR